MRATLDPPPFHGRFAPSPTGPLHFGSLIAALGSYAQARRAGGRWLLRIDDIDPPRARPGAEARILRTLEAFGFEWDTLLRQSSRAEVYRAALRRLAGAGLAYGCDCSRRQLARDARRGRLGMVYPGTCRGRAAGPGSALRLDCGGAPIVFVDRIRGPQRVDLEQESGDFVVRRRDGLVAYHLASALDDAETSAEVVRGADLLAGSAAQIRVQQALGLRPPVYAHLPLALDARGRKLGKQTQAPALDVAQALPALLRAWRLLGQAPPGEAPGSLREFWSHALCAWDLARVPASDARSD